MRSCSVCRRLEIVPGSGDDYRELADYHYRGSGLGPYAAIFALKPKRRLGSGLGAKVVGVIVYVMPSPGLELRNVATGNLFRGLDKVTQLALINENIRRIGRVIIEPRFRGLGLANRLVRETMPKMGVAIVEVLAVMGHVNPFFEKAGMKAYSAEMPARCVRLVEAFSVLGIEKRELIDPQKVAKKLNQLASSEGDFIEVEIRSFLKGYGRRREMPPGLERTRYILSKLTARPVYYIWLNPNLELRS